MDIITQLQDQTNHIAFLLFNMIGTVQRDAPPSAIPGQLTPAAANKEQLQEGKQTALQNGSGEAATASGSQLPDSEKQQQQQQQESVLNQIPDMAEDFVKALKLFDELVSALPVSVEEGEQEQLDRLTRLQEENQKVGKEIARELAEVERDMRKVRGSFHLVADHCLGTATPY